MKRTITLLMTVFALNGFSQSIIVELDTTQAVQDSDVGSVAYVEINLDGDNDLLITGNGPTTVITSTLHENDGSGNFTAVSQPAIVNVYAGAAEFADVDNDGDLDLLVCGANASDVSTTNVYENNGSGTLNLSAGAPFNNSHVGDIAFGDTDNDGD
jgi:hypothetical protein